MQFSTLMWLSRRINDVGLHFRSWWDHLKSLKPPYHQEKACKQTETSIGLSKDRKDLAVIKCSVVEIRWKATARKHLSEHSWKSDLAVIKCSVLEIRWKATARKHLSEHSWKSDLTVIKCSVEEIRWKATARKRLVWTFNWFCYQGYHSLHLCLVDC